MQKFVVSLLTAGALCLVIVQATAQSGKIQFTSINQVGLQAGQSGESGTFQSINGIKKGDWLMGVGAGFDFYGQRSVPLFLDVRKQFFKSFHKPFIYADGGVNFQWLSFTENERRGFPNANPGLFYEAGIGYNIYLKRQSAFVISAGYGYKRMAETFTTYRLGIGNRWQETQDHRLSEYRRVIVKFGFKI